MNTIVVCGLLGAGKTTFIRNFLKSGTQKTVVLVNDFGAAGIDGEIFSAGGIEAVELPSGCVCCTLKFDLITTIQKIMRQFAPERLVIEPSGVASPSGVLEALESAGVSRATVIGIVDATEFPELYESGMYGSFFEDQIASSDVVLVNKTDLAEEAKIVETEKRIEEVNPRAVVLRCVHGEARDLPFLQSGGEKAASSQLRQRSAAMSREEALGHDGYMHFETLSIKVQGVARLAVAADFFHELAAGRYGKVARAKALLQLQEGPYRFDIVFTRVDRVPFGRAVAESRIVVIGEGLNKPAIEETVQKRLSLALA